MSGKKWVLLVAGSKGWENYKHQANVCCHYHLIKREDNIPDEQIVTMMYDDIAKNPRNPNEGHILSVLGNENMYKNVVKDYTGTDVTPENFLNALQGKCTGKKVIKSGINDNIFVYMTGLGTESTFEFPEKSLLATEFIAAIQNMTDNEKFSKMIIFVDSSYSANLFKSQLSDNEKGTEITPTDYNQTTDVFLSDKFSSTWFHFLNMADYDNQTFHDLSKDKQSKFMEENTDVCPCFFGKLDPTKHYLSEFL